MNGSALWVLDRARAQEHDISRWEGQLEREQTVLNKLQADLIGGDIERTHSMCSLRELQAEVAGFNAALATVMKAAGAAFMEGNDEKAMVLRAVHHEMRGSEAAYGLDIQLNHAIVRLDTATVAVGDLQTKILQCQTLIGNLEDQLKLARALDGA